MFSYYGSAQLTGGAPGLQIRCGALKPSRVGSIPMHFRQPFTKSPSPRFPETKRFREFFLRMHYLQNFRSTPISRSGFLVNSLVNKL